MRACTGKALYESCPGFLGSVLLYDRDGSRTRSVHRTHATHMHHITQVQHHALVSCASVHNLMVLHAWRLPTTLTAAHICMWTSLECTYASRTALSWAHASKWSLPFVVSSRLTCYGLLTVYPAWQVTMWKSTSDMASATTHPKFGDVRANASQCTPAFSCFVSRGSARPPARGLPHSQFMGSVVQHFAGPPEAETWKLGAAFFGSNGALSQRTHACRPRRRAPSTCDCM